jgi:hypothetical protein
VSPASLASTLADEESTSRFILDKRHFNISEQRVKAKALEPGPLDHCTSVFRTIGLDEPSIWQLGDTHVATPRKKVILARADLTVAQIRSVGLEVEPDNDPARHALIRGWPSEKPAWRSRAQELAAIASLRAKM